MGVRAPLGFKPTLFRESSSLRARNGGSSPFMTMSGILFPYMPPSRFFHTSLSSGRFFRSISHSCSPRRSQLSPVTTSGPAFHFSRQTLHLPTAPVLSAAQNRPLGDRHTQIRCHASFIKQVMEQVRKEMESNEELRKSVKDFQESKVVEKSSTLRNQIQQAIGQVCNVAESTSLRVAQYYTKAKERGTAVCSAMDHMRESVPVVKTVANGFSVVGSYMYTGFGVVVDSVNRVLEHFTDEKAEAAKQRAERWRVETERRRAEQQRRENGSQESTSSDHTPSSSSHTAADATDETYALVVSKESAWERFGTTLRDMPFLQNFFDNPTLGKLFGESAQAAALREMKALDPTFKLPEFVELAEHVIAPHLLHSFLHGDREALRIQCREAAFAAVDQSIKEREVLKLSLDPTVLVLRNMEFRGAVKMPDSDPWFIFTFSAQQINCLRNAEGKVVVGAMDDIREVTYSVALKKHPEPDTEGLEYPWQVAEFAVIGNTPCW